MLPVVGRTAGAMMNVTSPVSISTSVEDYIPLIGNKTAERILKKGERARDLHVAHINSTYYGGGVAQTEQIETFVATTATAAITRASII